MFKDAKFKSISNEIDTIINANPRFPNVKSLTWNELKKYGVVYENIVIDNDGFVTIDKKFISDDKSMTRNSIYSLSKENYDDYTSNLKDIDVIELIINLEKELKVHSQATNFEICAVIRDQIEFLRDYYEIKETKLK